MKVICVWKVPAHNTRSFIQEMKRKNLHQDSYATLLNCFSGFNYWYETELCFGDVTELSANRISKLYGVAIKDYTSHE